MRAELAASAVSGSEAANGGPPSVGENVVSTGDLERVTLSAISRRRRLISTIDPKKMYPACMAVLIRGCSE